MKQKHDYDLDAKYLYEISFLDVKVGDVIKVTHNVHDWKWDYRHIHKVRIHPIEPEKSYASAIGYRAGTGMGGCGFRANDTFLLERVEGHEAFKLLTHYHEFYADPEIELHLDPRTIDV